MVDSRVVISYSKADVVEAWRWLAVSVDSFVAGSTSYDELVQLPHAMLYSGHDMFTLEQPKPNGVLTNTPDKGTGVFCSELAAAPAV